MATASGTRANRKFGPILGLVLLCLHGPLQGRDSTVDGQGWLGLEGEPILAERLSYHGDVHLAGRFLPGSPLVFPPFRAAPLGFRTQIRLIESNLTGTRHVAPSVGLAVPFYETSAPGGTRFQLTGLFAGHTRFDLEQDADLVATDWRYGGSLMARRGPWSCRLDLLHISSHLGDEWIKRVGRPRTNYVSESAAVRVAWDPDSRLRLYLSVENALRQTHTNETLGLALGAEVFVLARYFPSGLGPYLAGHLDSRGEIDHRIAVSGVLGYAFPGEAPGRSLDLQIVYHNGPSPVRQFFETIETYVGVGIALDL